MATKRPESELGDEFLCPLCCQKYGAADKYETTRAQRNVHPSLTGNSNFVQVSAEKTGRGERNPSLPLTKEQITTAEGPAESKQNAEPKPCWPPHSQGDLSVKLANLREEPKGKACEKLVILLLGETGCGKSTCVNAVANYIRFTSLDEALAAGKLQSYIPTKFFITDDNFEQNATLKPRIYNFKTDKYDVDLIDTPGIGDVSGIEQDKENMAEILTTLSGYENVNAICLLMKSNEARLTVNLSYCLSELLLRLHRDAAKNICFFFTNSRGTFYRPGDSLATLNVFIDRVKRKNGVELKLTQDNVFCLDNEAYRLVCAIQQGARFGEEQKKNFASSWTHSNREILRFLDYAFTRPKHSVEMTLNLNQARKLVLLLAKPMADIVQLTADNLTLSRRHLKEVEDTRAELSELNKKLNIPQESFVVELLQHPRTVCAGKDCVDTQRISNSTSLQTIYKKVCHDRCYLKHVKREKFPEPALRNCAAMQKRGKCRVCGCDWSLHIHIYFTQKKIMIEVEDPNVAKIMSGKVDAVLAKESMREYLRQRYQEMENEQAFIRNCSVYFASFLQDSSIIPYNDVFEEHAKRIIEEEKRLVGQGGDPATLRALERSLLQYAEEKKVIDEAFTNTGDKKTSFNAMTMECIRERLGKLLSLKHTGNHFVQFVEQIKMGEHKHERANVVEMESRWNF